MTNNTTTKECKRCHRQFELLNDNDLCKECCESEFIKMRCPECGHTWQNPGFAAWCPLCGNTLVTSDDKTIDEWIWKKEAEGNGVKFVGMQEGVDESPAYPLFQDDTTGSFTLESGETIGNALERKQREFFKETILK